MCRSPKTAVGGEGDGAEVDVESLVIDDLVGGLVLGLGVDVGGVKIRCGARAPRRRCAPPRARRRRARRFGGTRRGRRTLVRSVGCVLVV